MFFSPFFCSSFFPCKAKSLLKVRSLLGETAFVAAKKQLLQQVKSADKLAQLLEIEFVDAKDLQDLAPKSSSKPPPVLDSGLDVTTAFCLIVDVKTAIVNEIRSKFDKAFERWPPHINLFFPFVPFADFGDFGDRIGRAVEGFGEFDLPLDSASFFSQGKDRCTFNLQPSDDSQLQKLFKIVETACGPKVAGGKKKPFHPHLTLGQCNKADVNNMLVMVKEKLGSIAFRVTELCMIARFDDSPFKVIRKLPLIKRPVVAAGNDNDAVVAGNDNNAVVAVASVVGHDRAGKNDNGPREDLHILSCDNVQLLLLPQCASPIPGTCNFFLTFADDASPPDECEESEYVLVLLDTSASMNHDSQGRYLAPGSDDHPDSSIRKGVCVCFGFFFFKKFFYVIILQRRI